MNRGNIVKKIIIVAIWGVLLALLFIAAQNLPTIRHITEDSETTYEHATDEYRIDLTGRWQVSVDGPGELILLQEEANASIVCNLEVGGYDYLSSKEIADKIGEITAQAVVFIANAEKEYKDWTGGEKFTRVVDQLYALVPEGINMIITREMIEEIVQSTFDQIKEYATAKMDETVEKIEVEQGVAR